MFKQLFNYIIERLISQPEPCYNIRFIGYINEIPTIIHKYYRHISENDVKKGVNRFNGKYFFNGVLVEKKCYVKEGIKADFVRFKAENGIVATVYDKIEAVTDYFVFTLYEK